ncbi:GMC family oxidoreductase [Mycobacterium sherrisii]|uniref:GMC family oxidoreductase n=1 Tax=Mycobacterium sherrisii TaxID=243061 RepID=UPI0009FE5306|nr:GMC oxidoreductase [Mycobacterium sherrisii]MCV7031959.1 GMC family oxidoreductase N-terminal domain-containing protein [Mycobacterium sherrisii]
MAPRVSGETSDVEGLPADRDRLARTQLVDALKPHYDFVVCGAGSSGAVVARRLAENANVTVLLVESGGNDDIAEVAMPQRWMSNLGTDRAWNFVTTPGEHVNSRSIDWPMGNVLGGGSSINAMVWARGHREDWNLFAAAAKDEAWSYAPVLEIYRGIEDWHGTPDPAFRGSGGLVFVQPAPDPNPLAITTIDAARAVGIPTYVHPNGEMMQAHEGAAIGDLRIRDGHRESVFRSYTFPAMNWPNLTVLSRALVTRVLFDGTIAAGVELVHGGSAYRIGATEVVLSLGAINTPKVLLQSGIGDEDQLRNFGIPVVCHLPGVGRNLQDHVAFDCVWEYREPELPRNNMAEAVMYGTTRTGLTTADVFAWQIEVPYSTPENAGQFGLPEAGWTLHGAITHPKSRGQVRLSGAKPTDPPVVEANLLSHPDDVKTAIACVQWCREIGNAAPLSAYVKREVMPGNLTGAELDNFVRNAATTFFHPCGTAKMGHDDMSVVSGDLGVHGVENLRVADASIMPRITVGNTMAPCVVIGERAALAIKESRQL